MLPDFISLHEVTENVVGYIAGFVVRVIAKIIHCDDCYSEYFLENTNYMLERAYKFLFQKDRGKEFSKLVSYNVTVALLVNNKIVVFSCFFS